MKKSILSLLIATTLLFLSCKKNEKEYLKPCDKTSATNYNSDIRININYTGTTSYSKIEGFVLFTNSIDTLFLRNLNDIYNSSFYLDTSITVNSPNIYVKIFTISMKNISGNNFDLDNIADGNFKVFMNNEVVINSYGSNIALEGKIK